MKTTNRVPRHVAIIMDGNGRWAQKRGLPRTAGHKAGIEAIRNVIESCSELGVGYLTLYAFSTENWKRPAQEVSALMELLVYYLRNEIDALHKNKVRIRFIGEIEALPEKAVREIQKALAKTAENEGLTVAIAINYGGRQELVRAIRKLAEAYGENPDSIDARTVEAFLDTAGMPDPDLVIRPSGELRISNFLLWQMAYSELWFSDVLWPDFRREHLLKAFDSFAERDRRYGGLSKGDRQVETC